MTYDIKIYTGSYSQLNLQKEWSSVTEVTYGDYISFCVNGRKIILRPSITDSIIIEEV
jgi:hypothetical protein